MAASSKTSTKLAKTRATSRDDFALAYAKLRDILIPYQNQLEVTADSKYKFYTQTRSASHNGKPLFFAAVVMGKAYVSYHLMPLYWDPGLLKGISPELKKRMQGKSCFNFTEPMPALFRELSRLTAKGFALYRRRNLL
jgi:hypothetical protein